MNARANTNEAREEIESTDNFVISGDDVRRLQWMLSDAIKAKAELMTLRKNIEDTAAREWSGASLLTLLPRTVDLDIYEAAQMQQLLCVLPLHD